MTEENTSVYIRRETDVFMQPQCITLSPDCGGSNSDNLNKGQVIIQHTNLK